MYRMDFMNTRISRYLSLLMFALPLFISANGAAEKLSILVSRVEDIDQMDLPVTETLISWLESEFSEYSDISVDFLDEEFPLEEIGVQSAITAAGSTGGDIVILGSCMDRGTRIQLDIVAANSTSGPYEGNFIHIGFAGEDCLDITMLSPESPAPDGIRFFINLIVADWLSKEDQNEEAIPILDTALQYCDAVSRDYQTSAWTFKGDLSLVSEQYDSAIDAYSEALLLYPTDTYLLSARASCFDAIDDLESALDDLLILAEIDPNNASTIAQLGAELYQNGQYEDALLYLNHAINLDPSNAMAFRDRARVHYQKGDYDRALNDLDSALRLEPGSSQGLAFQGIVLHLAGYQDEAIEALTASIELERNPEVKAWSYYARANSYISLEDYGSALEDLTTSLECSGSSYTVLYLIGVCHMRLGDEVLAVEYLTEYLSYPLELSPMDPWTTEDLHETAAGLIEELQN